MGNLPYTYHQLFEDPVRSRILRVCFIGTFLEFYDFSLFTLLTPLFGPLFFPEGPEGWQVTAPLLIYSLALFLRPAGSILYGWLANTYGSRIALSFSFYIMAFGTLLLASAPTYASAGWGGAVLLALARALQGLAVGGQYSGAVLFSMEHCPPQGRTLCTALLLAASSLGAAFPALVCIPVFYWEEVSWGWRLPFLLGGGVALLSFYLRKKTFFTPPTSVSSLQDHIPLSPLRNLWIHHRKVLFACTLLCLGTSGNGVINFGFLNAYLLRESALPKALIGAISLLNATLMAASVLLWARFQGSTSPLLLLKRNIWQLAFLTPLTFACWSYPDSSWLVILGALFWTIGMGQMGALCAAIVPFFFPPAERYYGWGLALNLSKTFGIGQSLTVMTFLSLWGGLGMSMLWPFTLFGVALFGLSLLQRPSLKKSYGTSPNA